MAVILNQQLITVLVSFKKIRLVLSEFTVSSLLIKFSSKASIILLTDYIPHVDMRIDQMRWAPSGLISSMIWYRIEFFGVLKLMIVKKIIKNNHSIYLQL